MKPHEINGILLVNKPQNLTSNAVLQRVKRIYGAKKAGHTGSLDPMATGMLPICFGEATKWCQYLLDADKCYTTTGRLGQKTNTGDATGEIIAEVSNVSITEEDLLAALLSFQGEITQIPSMFSALKHNGTPLYKFARQGIEIPREARPVTISELRLMQFTPPDFQLTVTCSKGTYIRNLIEDIGDKLNVGAHVTVLHRCYTAGFATDPMFTLDTLEKESPEQLQAHLLPMDRALQHFPAISLNAEFEAKLRKGQQVTEKIIDDDTISIVRLYDTAGEFLGLGDRTEIGGLKSRRLLGSHF